LIKKKQKIKPEQPCLENYLVSRSATQVARRSSSAMRVAASPSFVVFYGSSVRAVGLYGYLGFI
jgi:hypothetical protein